MALKMLYLFMFMLLLSCQKEKCNCSLSEATLKDIGQLDSLIALPEIQKRDSIMWKFYNEPSLLYAENEAYRFSWFESFGETIICRVEEKDGNYRAVIKEYNREPGYTDSLKYFKEMEITEEAWTNITSYLDSNCFWTYPPDRDRNGLDGANWGLEGYTIHRNKCTSKNYHSVGRWSPDDSDSMFVSMCNLFLVLRPEKTTVR